MAELLNITHDGNNLNEYDSTSTDGGDLSTGTPGLASTTAKMELLIDDTNNIYAQKDQTAPASNQIRFRFYIDPNGLTMADDENLVCFFLGTSDYSMLHSILLHHATGVYKIVSREYEDDDTGGWHSFTITDAEHYIEVHIERASSNVASDGQARLWIDGNLEDTATALDNYDKFATLNKLRACAFSFTGTPAGTFYLDEIKANDDGSEIGPVAAGVEIALDALGLAGAAQGLTLSLGAVALAMDALGLTGSAGTASINIGASYYVDSNATNDSGDGSFGDPWKYIATHVDDLGAGDVMYLRGNVSRASAQVYAEDIRIGTTWSCVSGTASAPITIKPYDQEFVILRSSSSGVEVIQISNVDYWVIAGLDSDLHIDIDKQSQSDMAIDLRNADHITLQYLEIRNGDYYGIEVDDGTDYLTVRSCKIHDFDAGVGNDAHGIYARGGANCTVDDCSIYNCTGDCIQVEDDGDGDSVDNLEVRNCELWVQAAMEACVENAVDLKDGDGHHVHDNMIHGFGQWDDTCGGSGAGWSAPAIQIHQNITDVIVEDNVIYDCVTGVTVSSTTAGTIMIRRNVIRDLNANPGAGPSAAFYKTGSKDVDFFNNTIHNAPDYTIYLADGASNTELKNNLFNDGGNVRTGTATYTADYNGWFNCTQTISGGNDTTGTDPKFVDEGGDDYHLQSDSTAINAGVDVGAGYTGSAPDLGVYEYDKIVLDALSLAGVAQSLIWSGSVSLAMDVLGLAGAAEGLTLSPGAVALAMDALGLTGAAAGLSLAPGAVALAMDVLGLTGGAEGLTVNLATLIAMSVLGLTGAAQGLTLSPGAVALAMDRLDMRALAVAVIVSAAIGKLDVALEDAVVTLVALADAAVTELALGDKTRD